MPKIEKDIERKLREMVEKHGGLCLKWVCPGWSGVPDRIVLMPNEHIYFVETKRPKGGVIRELQKWWAKRLRRLGFSVYYVCDEKGIKDFEFFIVVSKTEEGEEVTP